MNKISYSEQEDDDDGGHESLNRAKECGLCGGKEICRLN